jgi:ATP synthase subunit 6
MFSSIFSFPSFLCIFDGFFFDDFFFLILSNNTFFSPMEQFEVFSFNFNLGTETKPTDLPLFTAVNHSIHFYEPYPFESLFHNLSDTFHYPYPVFTMEARFIDGARAAIPNPADRYFANSLTLGEFHDLSGGFVTTNYKLKYIDFADYYNWGKFEIDGFLYFSIFSLLFGFKTNFFLYSFLGIICFCFLVALSFPMNHYTVFPSYVQYCFEQLFFFKLDMIKQQVGYKGQFFFNFLISLFFFILFYNLLGIFPYSFTVTSHLVGNFLISSTLLIMFICIGIEKQGISFFKLFFPSSAPRYLLPLLFLIDVISYLSRGFSLAIRLFANLMAGHTLLNILCGFLIKLESVHFIAVFIPFLIVFLIGFLEIGIAFIQAYVFCVLVLVYLKDSLFVSGH